MRAGAGEQWDSQSEMGRNCLMASSDTECDTSPSSEGQTHSGKQATAVLSSRPGAAARRHLGRKRKAETTLSEVKMQAYLEQQQNQLQELIAADQNRQIQENNYMESMLRAQREGEERRFQVIQAQQQENAQIFRQLLNVFSNMTSAQSQHPPPTHWMPNPTASMRPSPTTTWSIPQSSRAQMQQSMLPPPIGTSEQANDSLPVSDVLHQVNSTQNFYNM